MITTDHKVETTRKSALAKERSSSDIGLEGPRIAVIDDDPADFKLLKFMLRKADFQYHSIIHYSSLESFLGEDVDTPDVVFLDRYLPPHRLAEGHIREIRARHSNCAVIMNTGKLTPSLRATAAHEGAVAVIEKGSLNGEGLSALINAAIVLGPTLSLSVLQ